MPPTKSTTTDLPLSSAKRALLESWSRGHLTGGIDETVIPCRRSSQPVPLSFAQERLWLLNQFESDSSVYNVPFGFQLAGRLDIGVLENCLNEIVRRHEALRTTFPLVEGKPVQVVTKYHPRALPVTSVEGLELSEQQARVRQLFQAEGGRCFDLTSGPLFSAQLARLGEAEHVLLFNIHHIIFDGWSVGILFRELRELYAAISEGRSSTLPDVPVQYADFAIWQRASLQGEKLERQLSYWRKQLANAPPLLELPTDFPRPPVRSFRGARQKVSFPKAATEALQKMCRLEKATLFMGLLAAFQTLLHRYTNCDVISIGSPIAGRNQVEIEHLIGFFVNTLVLRADFSGRPTFREVLRQVRQSSFEAYAHQDLPFEKLVEEVNPDRSLSHSPLFQVMFGLQNAPIGDLHFGRLKVTPLEFHSETAKFDLYLGLAQGPDGLRGALEYATDLFQASSISRMIGHFETLLESIVANPDRPVNELILLGAAERQQLLVDWNQTATKYPSNECLHHLFEAQAQKTPDTVALIVGEQQMTYRELNHRANRLVQLLQSLEAGPEVLIGIYLERSCELVIALLAVLKAGGAYVPMDPNYPKERISFMIADSKMPLLLTQSSLTARLPQSTGQVVCVDHVLGHAGRLSEQNPTTTVSAENLAYLIYTSGSTGQPKGVAIEHRSVIAFVHWARQVFEPEELAGVLASTSICFDLSIFELFVTLSCGGKVIIAENALQLPSLPAANEVTLINTVPSAMTELLRAAGIPDSVRVVNLAGEPLPATLVEQIYQSQTIQKVYDLYGPTETTVYSTFALRKAGEPATIGRPLSNEQIYLLNPSGQPVPVGAAGEMYIGGDGLARGYLHRPELTAEKFVPDPFGNRPGARLYKTGDLARYLPEGNIEFLGRIDNQVKVRGFRIELSEIEVALGRHPAVRECVVVVREDAPGDKRLAAYLAPRDEAQLSISDLRKFLGEKLPNHMVPSVFVILDALPRSPNGKLDRRALPVPDVQRPALAETFIGPQTPVEEIVNRIWCEVLELEHIGIHDNFFELGGHSLLATQVISRFRVAFDVDLPLRVFFEQPTIAGLALLIMHRMSEVSPCEEIDRLLNSLENAGNV